MTWQLTTAKGAGTTQQPPRTAEEAAQRQPSV